MLLNQGAVFSHEVGKETSPEAPPSGEKAEQRFFFIYLFLLDVNIAQHLISVQI